jgi:hypothetical protein
VAIAVLGNLLELSAIAGFAGSKIRRYEVCPSAKVTRVRFVAMKKATDKGGLSS